MHLIHALQDKYETLQDWTGSLYSGITLNWEYKECIQDIYMTGYVKEALHKFQHPTPSQPQHSPHQWNPPNYVSTAPQLAHQVPESPKIALPEANTVQQVVVTFLYFLRAVNTTILVALNIIASEQANSTEATAKSVTQLLDYTATHPEAIMRYHASDMTLHIHSYASFLSEPRSMIRAGGYHYLGTASEYPKNPPPKQPPLNGTIHAECTTMRNVLASAMEAELGAIFVKFQRVAATRMALI